MTLAIHDVRDRTLGDAEVGGDGPLAFAVGDALPHLAGVDAERRLVVGGVPAFGDTVRLVVEMGSQKQMGRVDAVTDIAGVTDEHPFWDWTIRQFPCHSMSQDVLPVPSHLPIAPTTALGPQPAITGAVRAAPERRYEASLSGGGVHQERLTPLLHHRTLT